ncbi:focadhesin isoform X2 [Galleria mellonella]|uniref:Focadhesin isoform X2 n=1 Tax=Galleria mellonella TaxID=7137 RepID=A0ABM3MWZ9_GALME|nr:focadhesin isoform X2 [Galleria mellonella]
MDEIEYKLNTKNSVLIVNAIDKLINTIKSKYKVGERQKFVLENEELKFLRDKCSSKEAMVSLTACQGLLALVELGVLEIGHTMSTVITLLPSAHNVSAIISTMAGLLILDLKSRLVPGQPYKCQFSLKSPKHPFITVLEKNKNAEDDVLVQMQALCTHPDYIVSSNSLELLRSVFLWLTCNPQHGSGVRPWQLLLSLPQSTAQSTLLLACLSCQQVCNPDLIERAFAAYSVVTDAAVYRQNGESVMALLPMLARISNELIKHGRDPRSCYTLIERCFALEAPELRTVAGLVVSLLAENLNISSALHLHELFNLCLNIINKYEHSTVSLNVFVALSLQWLNLPSCLTSDALKAASKILDIYQANVKEDTRLHMPNLKANKIFQSLLYTDSHLSVTFKLNEIWERVRDNPDKLSGWFDSIESVDELLKYELLPFLLGLCMERRKEDWFEEVVLRALRVVIELVGARKEVSVMVLPLLTYKIANDRSPRVKLECLRALPKLAKYKENVPRIVAVLNKLKTGKGAPTSFLVMLYSSLAETQVRCFPYLQEMLVDPGTGRPDELKWEVEVARATAVERICEIRPSSHGLELVSTISSILNRCSGGGGGGGGGGLVAAGRALAALAALWRGAAVAPAGSWRALQPRLHAHRRPALHASLCKLLSEVPALRVQTPEYDKLVSDTARKLWSYIAESNHPEVVEAACDALAGYKIDDYKLKDIPEVYRRTVKLPASYCKTPADAARKPEDVLDYVPSEVWPEVFRYTNQAALAGVGRLARRLIERELRGLRGGAYQLDGRPEPPIPSPAVLHHNSVLRGLLQCFRTQVTSPSYEFPDTVLLAILQTLAEEYPKPFPPMDLCFLHEAVHRGGGWRHGCTLLAAAQAHTTPSARRFLENYLHGIVPGTSDDSDIMTMFEILPILCRGMPPNTIRAPVERCLSYSFSAIAKVRSKGADEEGGMFVKQLAMIQQCLECERIHDANRTLLSQIVENYFSIITDDNVAWAAYVRTCGSLSSKYLERMTSPSSWWETSAELLRKAAAIRCAAALSSCSLVWLNELIDAQAQDVTGQEFSLQCMIAPLKAAKPDDPSTREWFMQLMARTQVAFNETEDRSAKLYLCDVFILSVVMLCGHWALCPDAVQQLTASARRALLPAACVALLAREAWTDCTLHMLEWLYHTRDSVGDPETAMWCQRALLALRHTYHFAHNKIWTKLESHFGNQSVTYDIKV